MANEEKPQSVKKLEELSDRVDNVIETTDFQHRKAFVTAEEEHLMNEKGELDYDKLRDEEVQDKFAETMASHYLEAAKSHFKVGEAPSGDPIYDDRLMQAYAGITKTELKASVREAKEKFTYENFDKQIKPGMMKKIRDTLAATKTAHLTDDDKSELIKHAGLDGLVDADKLNVQEAAGLYDAARKNKGVSKPLIEAVPDYALTDKAKTDFDIGNKAYKKAA